LQSISIQNKDIIWDCQ